MMLDLCMLFDSPPPYRPTLSLSLDDLRSTAPPRNDQGWQADLSASCFDIRPDQPLHGRKLIVLYLTFSFFFFLYFYL